MKYSKGFIQTQIACSGKIQRKGHPPHYGPNWKVIALMNGQIEAVSGPAAQDRPGAHEWIVWEGPAADKGEALQSAEKADSRVDLKWMRVRYELDLNKRRVLLGLYFPLIRLKSRRSQVTVISHPANAAKEWALTG